MIRHIVFSILFCLFTLNGWAQQSNGLNSLAERLERFGREIPQEKVFVHMDNTCYFLGDTIRFSAYTRQTNTDEPSRVSNVLYAELYNNEGYLVERKLIEMKEGWGNGFFALDKDIMYSGFYELRAYTRWQLNWGLYEHKHVRTSKWFLNKEFEKDFYKDYDKLYSRVFPVYDKPAQKGAFDHDMTLRPLRRYFNKDMDEKYWKMSLTLFPEGGNLVAGVENRVAFEAAMSDGEHLEGTLMVGNEEVKTVNRGRGMFTLIPEKGMERDVTFTAKDGQKVTAKLPKPEEQGVAVQVRQEGEDITIHANVVGLTPDSLAMTVMHEGKVEAFELIHNSQITIHNAKLEAGIHQVTVFDTQGRVWADRLFFVTKPELATPTLTVSGLKDEYKPYERIEMEVTSSIHKKGIGGGLSLAVRDSYQADALFDNGNIMTEMLLASEIKGFIPNPGWYFEKNDEEHRLGLDLLMMTQGWRRFVWQDMAVKGDWTIKQPMEKTPIITGTISNNSYWKGKGGKIIEPELAKKRVKIHAELDIPGRQERSIGEMETINGRFTMSLPAYDGDALFYLSASDTTKWKRGKEYEWVHELNNDEDRPKEYVKRYPISLSEFHVRINFPYPRFVKPYTFYQNHLNGIPDNSPGLQSDVLADGTHQMREVKIHSRFSGLRKFDDSQPALILDAYDAVNHAYDAGMKYIYSDYMDEDFKGYRLGRFSYIQMNNNDWINLDEDRAIAISYIADMGVSANPTNIMVRYGLGYTRRCLMNLQDIPKDSVYHSKYLHSFSVGSHEDHIKSLDDELYETEKYESSPEEMEEYKDLGLLDKILIYTDYYPRKEGSQQYWGSDVPETTIVLYPYPNGARRPVYRDRRYILPGFAYPAEFYSPDYSKQTPPEPTDYRRTLYWNPNLQLDENGQARITFYNNSRTTQISVEAEGQASDGTLLWSK